jgi:hypothetical protein
MKMKAKMGLNLRLEVDDLPQGPRKPDPIESSRNCSHILENIWVSDYSTATDLKYLEKENFTHILNCNSKKCKNHFPNNFTYQSFDIEDHPNFNLLTFFYLTLHFITSAPEHHPSTIRKTPLFFKHSPKHSSLPPTLPNTSPNTNTGTEHLTDTDSELSDSDLKLTSYESSNTDPCSEFKMNKILIHCSAGISRAPALLASYMIWKHATTVDQTIANIQDNRSVVDPNIGFLVQLNLWYSHFYPKSAEGSRCECVGRSAAFPQCFVIQRDNAVAYLQSFCYPENKELLVSTSLAIFIFEQYFIVWSGVHCTVTQTEKAVELVYLVMRFRFLNSLPVYFTTDYLQPSLFPCNELNERQYTDCGDHTQQNTGDVQMRWPQFNSFICRNSE